MTFKEFADAKTTDAERASIPGFETDFDRAPENMTTIGNEWSRRLFDGPFHLSPLPSSELPGCSLVFVQSKDGNTGAANPSDLAGGETDKHVIYEGLSRVAADAVLAGAETIRGGDIVFSVWHPEVVRLRESFGKPRHPAQIVATLRGLDIDHGLLFNVPELRVFIITVRGCADLLRDALRNRPWITPIVMPRASALASALAQLREEHGIDRISCVGGRSLATQLLDASVVQDLYLTTSAKTGGEPRTPMYPKPLGVDALVRKRGRGSEVGVVFEHLRL